VSDPAKTLSAYLYGAKLFSISLTDFNEPDKDTLFKTRQFNCLRKGFSYTITGTALYFKYGKQSVVLPFVGEILIDNKPYEDDNFSPNPNPIPSPDETPSGLETLVILFKTQKQGIAITYFGRRGTNEQ
jgi:hypothetical protein